MRREIPNYFGAPFSARALQDGKWADPIPCLSASSETGADPLKSK